MSFRQNGRMLVVVHPYLENYVVKRIAYQRAHPEQFDGKVLAPKRFFYVYGPSEEDALESLRACVSHYEIAPLSVHNLQGNSEKQLRDAARASRKETVNLVGGVYASRMPSCVLGSFSKLEPRGTWVFISRTPPIDYLDARTSKLMDCLVLSEVPNAKERELVIRDVLRAWSEGAPVSVEGVRNVDYLVDCSRDCTVSQIRAFMRGALYNAVVDERAEAIDDEYLASCMDDVTGKMANTTVNRLSRYRNGGFPLRHNRDDSKAGLVIRPTTGRKLEHKEQAGQNKRQRKKE